MHFYRKQTTTHGFFGIFYKLKRKGLRLSLQKEFCNCTKTRAKRILLAPAMHTSSSLANLFLTGGKPQNPRRSHSSSTENEFSHGVEKSFLFLQNKNLLEKYHWNPSLFGQKPINLLFSTDQFFFEFSKKKSSRKKLSEFSRQLKERKKFILFYGNISKKRLFQHYLQAKKFSGYFSKNFLALMEKRLDVLVYRTGLVESILLARQLILHKHVLVNNLVLDNPNYLVKPADIISIGAKVKKKIQEDFKKKGFFFSKKPSMHSKRDLSLFSKLSNVQKEVFLQSLQKSNQKHSSKKWIGFLIHWLLKVSFLRIAYKKKEFSKWRFLRKQTLASGGPKKLERYLVLVKLKAFLGSSSKNACLQKQQGVPLRVFEKHLQNLFTKKALAPLSPESQKRDSLEKFLRTQYKPFLWSSQNPLLSQRRETSVFSQENVHLHEDLSQKNSFGYCTKRILRNDFFYLFQRMDSSPVFHHSLFYKLKKHYIPYQTNRVSSNIRALRLFGLKPIHLEISYKNKIFIVLYSPQRVLFPFYLDLDLIGRSLQ